jgi:putative sterol carrier protein
MLHCVIESWKRIITIMDLMQAFFEGKLKVSGNTALALKLQSVMPKPGQAKL